MEKVIIFTNCDSLYNLNEANTKISGADKLTEENKNILFLYQSPATDGERPILKKVDTLQDGRIFFMYDDSDRDFFLSDIFKTLGDKDILYILYHGGGNCRDFEQSSCLKPYKGRHINNDLYYGVIMPILTRNKSDCEEDNIVNEVINVFKGKFQPDCILQFLYGCLEKKPDDADYKKLKNVGININDASKFHRITLEPGNGRYDEELKQLRNELLSAVMKLE